MKAEGEELPQEGRNSNLSIKLIEISCKKIPSVCQADNKKQIYWRDNNTLTISDSLNWYNLYVDNVADCNRKIKYIYSLCKEDVEYIQHGILLSHKK